MEEESTLLMDDNGNMDYCLLFFLCMLFGYRFFNVKFNKADVIFK